MTSSDDTIDLSAMSSVELVAHDLIEQGEIDQAIAIYEQIQPKSAHVFRTIGMLYADRKGNYEVAISCFEQALQLQEKDGKDISDSLTRLGFAYQNLRQFELSLNYHRRALALRRLQANVDRRLLGSNLFGIANAHWGQRNLTDALTYAHQALVINQSIKSGNESNIASNLAILANIYHHCGDDNRALELAQQSLELFERSLSPHSMGLASVLNNIGAIQISAGRFDEALVTFIRVLHICESTVSEDHPKRIAITQNIQRVIAMQQQGNALHSFQHLGKLSAKFLLF